MGLLSHALAIGAGYALARPEARQKLVELAQHPKVTQLREHGQDLATNGLQIAKRRLGRSHDTDPTSTAWPAPPSSDRAALREGVLPPAQRVTGATVEEDSQAAVTGLASLPRPVPPTSPTDTA